jgi:uncharacterized 2Fe-2S/4Fe-4S cluster protein (DUF4445 family)
VRNVVKVETATEPDFQALFVAAMAFPHALAPSPHLGEVVTLPQPITTAANAERGGRRRRRDQPSTSSVPTDAAPAIEEP